MILILCALKLVTPAPPQAVGDPTMSAVVESKLATWLPGKNDRLTPDPSIWLKDASPVGKWSTGGRMSRSTMSIRRSGSNSFGVDFVTAGCLSEWTLKRSATFSGGVLQFNRA